MRVPELQCALTHGATSNRSHFKGRHNDANDGKRGARRREIHYYDLINTARFQPGEKMLEILLKVIVNGRREILNSASTLRLAEEPEISIDSFYPPCVQAENVIGKSRRHQIFADPLNIDATGLSRLSERSPSRNASIGVCTDTAVDHRKAGQILIWNNCEDGRDANVRCNIVENWLKTRESKEPACGIVLRFERRKDIKVVRAVFGVPWVCDPSTY
jgi:hypothetical protein